jgi:hypothetical protein
MAQQKSQKIFNPSNEEGLGRQVQDLSYDMAAVFNRGLKIGENLNMAFITVPVKSDEPIRLSEGRLGQLAGAVPVLFSVKILGQQMRLVARNEIEYTITYDGLVGQTTPVTFLLLGA